MQELTNTITAAIVAFACIAVGAWYVSPLHQEQPLSISQIHTDKATHYPYVASVGRTWCVEQSR
jgi:hypothetical protein